MIQNWSKSAFLTERQASVLLFSLFFAWLLAFPFEGQVLYALADSVHIDPHPLIFGAVFAQFAGLCSGGFVAKTMRSARQLMVFSNATAMAATILFFFPPSALWLPALALSSFLAGCCVAAWGFFLRAFTPANERIKTAADGLIYSNLLMILLNMAALHISPYVGLGLCLLMLVLSLPVAFLLPTADRLPAAESPEQRPVLCKPLAFLYLFVAIITFNSGLMYQVFNPAFTHLDWLVSWYWALPYIAALYVMRNLPRTVNRTHILYVGIAMIGFSFLAFTVLDRSAGSYLVVNTLMLGACGVFDLFWWSILGEMLDYSSNPAKVFGIGLSANVLGVLAGGMTGQALAASGPQFFSLLALTVVCVVLVILPPLSNYLACLLKEHVYLTIFSGLPLSQQKHAIQKLVVLGELTERESEVATLIAQGKTYRQVASALYISENTVKTHVKNIYAKYQVQNRSQLLHLMLDQQPPVM